MRVKSFKHNRTRVYLPFHFDCYIVWKMFHFKKFEFRSIHNDTQNHSFVFLNTSSIWLRLWKNHVDTWIFFENHCSIISSNENQLISKQRKSYQKNQHHINHKHDQRNYDKFIRYSMKWSMTLQHCRDQINL